ncbi:carbamoyltransferase HypF [Rhodococcus sp. G-MC3]|uniref:carbamoyltransferase HypF n=1 Tax=Rhodococcus sp. G-MC3 TaxID=3046209 RepID=UPI0024BB143F|nr:carbamoyltransferase HypF [Rhodococcus sp. G-MC3]MDJ0394694.1 carbamoyltransferase HypF [Rhodococcus sp. G-MC3]
MRARRRFEVSGVVQGVGFRPFVYTTASELSLSGSVGNNSCGVEIEVEGEPAALDAFEWRLRQRPPVLALVESIVVTSLSTQGGNGFHIADTRRADGGRTLASPDVAICRDCLVELADPTNARYRHPFITCTNCGPRFTIITDLPYDRASTTMGAFSMCPRCAIQYQDPSDRRFHAQTIACHDCGPTLRFTDGSGTHYLREDALRHARALLMGGGILAVKGIGGFHLACDASNATAVQTLRSRKQRGDKPFAVMVRDIESARALATLGAEEEALLDGVRKPIVLVTQRDDIDENLARSVAPGNRDIGLMLAYTPLHHLLLGLAGDEPGPFALVMTSGNLGGEPIVHDNNDARHRLMSLTDAWLDHDRGIVLSCDDSVARVVDGAELPVRRSRGYSPLPLTLPFDVPASLAVGADLKNTMCVAEGRYAWVSQHIGDMDDLATLQTFSTTATHLQTLTGVTPVQLIADAHPGYRSSMWAQRHAGGRPMRTVQHHHAHVAAVMGEHGLDGSSKVLGFAFDGTGYGPDGAVWGGEVLVADYKEYQRLTHLSYVQLAGGDSSVERPYRMALSHLHAAGIDWSADLPSVNACPPRELAALSHQLDTGFGCVPTSSMGRLFDAVASLVGVRHVVEYEAQAAIELEALARGVDCGGVRYEFALPNTIFNAMSDGGTDSETVDCAPVIRAVVTDIRAGVPAAVVAARFHDAVATAVVHIAEATRASTGQVTVVLTGGVFQNALLLSSTVQALRASGFVALRPHRLPPNDGGLALGQILIGCAS